MDKQKLNELYALTKQLRDECCEKFAEDREGICCYDDGSNKVEFCLFSVSWICIAEDFMGSLDMIANSLNKEENGKGNA